MIGGRSTQHFKVGMMLNSAHEEPPISHRAGNTVAFLSSLVVHVSLLLLLACWAYTAGKPSHGLMLNAEMGTSESLTLDMVQTFELEPEQNQPEQQASSPEFSMDVAIGHVLESTTDAAGPSLQATLASLSMEDVSQNLKLEGKGRGASFFGSYAHGDRFVYVLDSSQSMKGDRWIYACNQLIDSLNGLKEGQEFFVICFDMETTFLFNSRPNRIEFCKMDSGVVQRVRNWLKSRRLGRATMPAEALHYALTMNPDAIFLLSDGELQDDTVLMLRTFNGRELSRQIPIHTVHLFSEEGRLTLQQIAYENAGSFTPVGNH